MQLICHADVPDYTAWKAAFDAEVENIEAAGLSTLQIWRNADQPSRVVVLFEVHDRGRVQTWLSKQNALGTGFSSTEFVETA